MVNKEVVSKRNFQEKWFISNDNIVKCCDCQFRYSCVSNSDILTKKGKYYKKSTCKFNPSTNEWMPK